MASNFLENTTKTVKVLLAINVLMFAITYFMPEMKQLLALHYFKSPFFEPFQIITHFFMHGGPGHIMFNMYALVMFGSVVERSIGAQKFLTLYVLSAIGAFVLHMLVVHYQLGNIAPEIMDQVVNGTVYESDPQEVKSAYMKFNVPMLGASGAIMGVLAAFGVMYPDAKLGIIFLPFQFKAKYFIPLYMAIEIFLGVNEFSWDNIAHFAHIGGAIIGFVLMMMWKKDLVRY